MLGYQQLLSLAGQSLAHQKRHVYPLLASSKLAVKIELTHGEGPLLGQFFLLPVGECIFVGLNSCSLA